MCLALPCKLAALPDTCWNGSEVVIVGHVGHLMQSLPTVTEPAHICEAEASQVSHELDVDEAGEALSAL